MPYLIFCQIVLKKISNQGDTNKNLQMLQFQAIITTVFNELCLMYSKYFSNVVKSQGVPHLDADQFTRYQNIIAL